MAGAEANRERAAVALSGVTVAVTRSDAGADAFVAALVAAGARPIVTPLIRIAPAGDEGALRAAADEYDSYDWIVFTSVNAVLRFVGASVAAPVGEAADGRAAHPGSERVKVAAVGPATAAAAAAAGFQVAAVPESHVAGAVAAAIEAVSPLTGARVLWPRAALARRELATALRSGGAHVDEVEAYRTETNPVAATELAAMVARADVDVLTFTSPSAIDGYVEAGGTVAEATIVAVIGPVTAAAARTAGLPVHVQPGEHTTDALVEALCAFFDRRRRAGTGTERTLEDTHG